MGKTGTEVDLLELKSRKGRARRRAAGSFTPYTFGPTCLITCPKTLVNNVSFCILKSFFLSMLISPGCVQWKREIETVSPRGIQNIRTGLNYVTVDKP